MIASQETFHIDDIFIFIILTFDFDITNTQTIRCLRFLQFKRCRYDSLPEIWDKMATDVQTLTKYGDQTLL
jgi:hypothetical protein